MMRAPVFKSFTQEGRGVFGVAAILLLALLTRVWGLDSESAWIDEAYSMVLAEHSIVEIIRGAAADQHPPFYYLLLHLWMFFGDGVIFARWLSVLIGWFGVYQAMLFAKDVGGHPVGLLSGFLVALSPLHVWYSQEVRMYILLSVFATGVTHLFWKSLQEENKKYWTYVSLFVLTLLGLFTHYFFIFVVFAQGVWILMFSLRKKEIYHLVRWAVSTGVAGVFFLPWVPIASDQIQAHPLKWLSTPSLAEVQEVFLQIVFGGSIQILPDWSQLVVLIFIAGSMVAVYLRLGRTSSYSYTFLLWFSLCIFALVAVISIVYPIFQYKQFVIIVIPLLVLLAWTLIRAPRLLGAGLFVVVFFLSSATIVYQAVSITKDNWAGATRYLESHFETEDVIFGNPAAVSLALTIYQEQPFLITGYPSEYSIVTGGWEGETITEEIADKVLNVATQGKRRLWLVEYLPEFWDPHRYLEKWLKERGEMCGDQYFGRIRIRLYNIDGDGGNCHDR